MSSNMIIPTAEPFFIPGGRTGCLLIHGFTGTPKEMRMLGDSLADDGYTVLAPRLFGHATQPQDMSRAHWEDWVASVEDGLNLLKGSTDRQFIMGLSMGGILSLIAAARHRVTGVVTFSAPCSMPQDPRIKLLPLLGWLNIHAGKGEPDWRNADAKKDHVDYPYFPSRSVLELRKLIEVMQTELRKVQVPALLVQSRNDTSIPKDSMQLIFNGLTSTEKSMLWVENSGHVVIREPEREKIFTAVKSFLNKIVQST